MPEKWGSLGMDFRSATSEWEEMFSSAPELQHITSQLIAAERARLDLDPDDHTGYGPDSEEDPTGL